MEIKKKRSLRNTVVVSIVSLIGFLSSVISLYVFFFQDQKPRLSFEIVSEASVLDINTSLSKLKIYYDNTDLEKTSQTLRVLQVKIVNTGGKDILKGDFDSNFPVAIGVTGGKILENPEIVDSSNPYLKSAVKFNALPDKISLSDFILETNQFLVFKVLIISDKSTTPKIFSDGKIAGQNTIPVVDRVPIKGENSFWIQTFSGDFLVQLVRLLAYAIIFIAILAVVIFLSVKTSEYFQTRRRRSEVNSFLKSNPAFKDFDPFEKVLKYYLNDSYYLIKEMYLRIQSEKNIGAFISKNYLSRQEDQPLSYDEVIEYDRYAFSHRSSDKIVAHHLVDCDLVEGDGKHFVLKPGALEFLKAFVEYVDGKRIRGGLRRENVE